MLAELLDDVNVAWTLQIRMKMREELEYRSKRSKILLTENLNLTLAHDTVDVTNCIQITITRGAAI